MCRTKSDLVHLFCTVMIVAACGCNPNASSTPDTQSSDTTASESNGDPSKVLRHAVFFKFNETSTDEDIQNVVDAFASLPTKIPEIIGFQYGTNNSSEGFDDGFTHCFLLTFKDEAGREVYLPHADHKAFGDVLRPHMAGVFVIDYWGNAGDSEIDRELKHAVFFKFTDDTPAEKVKELEDAFAALPSKIPAIKDFEWGTNNSPEKHDDGFTHCFMVTFDSEEGREEYLPHAEHQAFVEAIKPSLDNVRVLDFWETK
ncbi:MAG: Dabb family protein [Planctomycetales bacterium]|nr:Dabb family protein [Planctomycetales bacterium]